MKARKIDTAIKDLKALKSLAEAYAKISAVRMQETRGAVLLNRVFMDDMHSIFQEVLVSYRQEIIKLSKKKGMKKGKKITLLGHNGRTVCVFLSANTGLYGDIVQKTLDLFLKEIQESDVEITIIGRLGRALFSQVLVDRPFTYFDLPDYKVAQEQLSTIMKHLVQYQEIRVYFGKFQSFIHQKAVKLTISAEVTIDERDNEHVTKYIFEPDIGGILAFFETELFTSLLNQSIHESQLAKLASRAYAMDRAEENITQDIVKKRFERLKQIHRVQNRKQLNILSSVYSRR